MPGCLPWRRCNGASVKSECNNICDPTELGSISRQPEQELLIELVPRDSRSSRSPEFLRDPCTVPWMYPRPHAFSVLNPSIESRRNVDTLRNNGVVEEGWKLLGLLIEGCFFFQQRFPIDVPEPCVSRKIHL